ncbi:hypothetical protein SAMN05720468_11094 [Fibrobacter sp. UWEL]|nr:hypothetical protein SAMN05720468_11094 [Fibrobacter sp. UWEL]
MCGRSARAVLDGGLLCGDDLIGNGAGLFRKPHPGLSGRAVVRFTKHLDTSIATKGVHLLKALYVTLGIYRKCAATVIVQNTERRNIAGSVGNIHHILERHATDFPCDGGIDVDGFGILVASLVDFKDVAGLGSVIQGAGDLGDFLGSYRFAQDDRGTAQDDEGRHPHRRLKSRAGERPR